MKIKRTKKRRRTIGCFLYSAIAILLLTIGAILWIGNSLVAPVPKTIGNPPQDFPAETVRFKSESGSTIAGWFVPANPSKGTVVLLHSIRSSRLSMVARAKFLLQSGYSTLLIDLQAHGESPGKHITFGYLEGYDASAAVSYARQRNPKDKIAVVGMSLGGAAAVLSRSLGADAAVLEEVYPTIEEAVTNRLKMRFGSLGKIIAPLLLVQIQPRLGISTDELRPRDRISSLRIPITIMAGSEDRHTTLAETRRLYNTAREPKNLVIFNGAAHVDLYRYDPVLYKRQLLSFLLKNI